MGNRDSSLIIKEEEEVKKEVQQEAQQKVKQEAQQVIKREVGQEVGQKIQQEVEQEVKQEVEQKVKQEVRQEAQQEVKQEFQREFKQEIKQEVEGDTNTPVVPEDVIIPAAVVFQEEVKPVLTHVSVKRPSSINIESRPHDKHRRRTMVRTTTPKPGPNPHPAPVCGTSLKTTPVVQPPNVSRPAACQPAVVRPIPDVHQVVPVQFWRTRGIDINGGTAAQRALLHRLESRLGEGAEWDNESYEWAMERAIDQENEAAKMTWRFAEWNLRSWKSAAEHQVERLECRIRYKEWDTARAESSK